MKGDPLAAPPEGVQADRADALYGLPLDEFTSSRDALAKELRQAGLKEPAAWVKRLKKPTAAAWVVNQLARTQKREATSLIKAGERLRKVHEDLLAGKAGPEQLRSAAEKQREAVGALVERGAGLLDRLGHSPSQASLDRVAETLEAVAVDEETRAVFAAGRLTRERRAAGLGLVEGQAGAAPRKGKGPRPDDRARARQALKDAKGRLRERQRAVADAERELADARKEAERSQRRLEQASRALERAQAEEAEAAERVDALGGG